MLYTINITPTAIDDIEEGLEYYNSKAENLGYRFADEVDENLQSIAGNPFAFAERYRSVRGKLLKVFPYLVLYKINRETNSIEVLRIFNTWQNPYWG